MHMLGTLPSSRAMLRERTQSGLEAARTAGGVGGRPHVLSPNQEQEILVLMDAGRTAADAARLVGVSRSTVSRIAARERIRRAGVA